MQLLLYLAAERLGMTVEEAIVATTYNAVCALRLSHATGSIEPGKSADLALDSRQPGEQLVLGRGVAPGGRLSLRHAATLSLPLPPRGNW